MVVRFWDTRHHAMRQYNITNYSRIYDQEKQIEKPRENLISITVQMGDRWENQNKKLVLGNNKDDTFQNINIQMLKVQELFLTYKY